MDSASRLREVPARDRSLLLPGMLRGVRGLAVRHWAACALSAIVLAAALLSLRWVFLVPIYEAPDEPTHLDYAFSIYTAGHLLNARDGPAIAAIHPYTLRLLEASDIGAIAFHPLARVPPSYGTASYYRAIDRSAAKLDPTVPPHKTPWLLSVYPFGYYALVAAWLRLVSLFTHSLVALFFAARIFSVLLLMCSLVLGYGIARELRLTRQRALLLIAVIGFFPLTSFVSSYVQPDNLGLTLVNLSLYLALVARRRPGHWPTLALLGVALGMLLVSKYQFYVCVLIPVLAMVLSRRLSPLSSRIGWARLWALLMVPSLLTGLVQLWVSWGARGAGAMGVARKGTVAANYAAAHVALSHGIGAFLSFLLNGLGNAFRDYYLDGTTAASYFGVFGWLDTRLMIGSLQLDDTIRSAITQVTLLILTLTLAHLAIITWRLLTVARRYSWRSAIRIACSNPVLNSYFLFTVFMFLLYALTDNSFGAQGRDWFPFVVPAFLVGAWFAPRALPQRRARAVAAGLVLFSMAAYSAVGSYYSVQAIQTRYYGGEELLPATALSGLAKLPVPTVYALGAVTFGNHLSIVGLTAPRVQVKAGQELGLSGWAVDTASHSLAGGVFITVDDRMDYPAIYRIDRPDVARALHSAVYEKSGFYGVLSTAGLAPGGHYLRIKILTQDRGAFYEPPQKVPFVLQR